MNFAMQLIVSVFGTVLTYGLYVVFRLLYSQYTSTFRIVPGPPPSSWWTGNFNEILATENTIFYKKWTDEYGPTIRFRLFFNISRLYTADTKALNHILLHDSVYHKPAIMRWSLGRISGPGLFYVQDHKHKIQRKIMNPAFSPGQLREFTQTFLAKASELRDIWASQINEGETQVDALSWLSKTTLDIIGLSGFNYDFHALSPDGDANELHHAFSTGFQVATRLNIWTIVQGVFSITRLIPSPGSAALRRARNTMRHIGEQLLHESKAYLKATGEKAETWRARDLLSLLVRSNMSTDLQDNQRMSDADVIAQVPTFLVAGHDTTSVGTTWALYALTQHKSVQNKLREELLSVPTENPTAEDLNSLPYLDAVVRETLRVHSPAPETARVAVKDDVLPLNIPFTDRSGVVHHEIRIKKGQHFLLAISGVNMSKKLWGEDAMEFRPERWLEPLPEAVSSIPGVWGHMMTFFGGSHGCIGYRFALLEMKALLFILVRAFQMDLAVPGEQIISRTAVVQRPHVRDEIEAGGQLPVLIKPCSRA
ncbi:cytochrome P450 monooxygenase [Gymnopus androsaceus JB14]|uniref:Cytochrome P450 monooxygenase n=1 Tax=Gymnopus androsaceus JB14 TaxID=1447944 RepID=A0A6A4IUA3_9AGAR|nr:cytochrome P450 monooxygenase [Gymnopus androsaceus JB14]